ncbi:MAG: hypothetical protein IOD03_11890 [Methylocystis sp.]|nr:hypothetical protein [Methylocystis sp.]
MNDGHLNDNHNVVRYIKPRHIDNGVINGEGFLCRPGEDAPSVNWLECFSGPLENQLSEIKKLKRISYARTGRLAKLNVGNTKKYISDNHRDRLKVYFIIDAKDAEGTFLPDPSHSLITNIPVENTPEAALIKDLISDCVVCSFPT